MKKIIHDFKLALKKERMKFTDQRYMVLKFLFDNKGHFECEDIIQRLKRKNKKVSRATVYRTLDTIKDINLGLWRVINKLRELVLPSIYERTKCSSLMKLIDISLAYLVNKKIK